MKEPSWFNSKNNDKKIIWIVSIFFASIFFIQLMLTISYAFDLEVAKTFYKSMSSYFIRFWSGLTVIDGYISVVTFSVPLTLILIESFYLWMKNRNQNGWFTRNYSSLKWIHIGFNFFYTIIFFASLWLVCFKDKGFGDGFSREFLIGWKYLIPIFVIISFYQLSLLYISSWYIRVKLSKREDFLSSEYWKISITILIFICIVYVPVVFLKYGMRRPYYYNTIWGDVLNEIKQTDPDRFIHYMNQTQYNWGYDNGEILDDFKNHSWNNIPADFPWWKSQGFLAGKNPILPRDSMVKEQAMSSGHLAAAMGISSGVILLFASNKNDKKHKILKWSFFSLTFVYILNMVFALLCASSHWLSDIAFTITTGPLCYFLAKKLVSFVANKVNLKLTNTKS